MQRSYKHILGIVILILAFILSFIILKASDGHYYGALLAFIILFIAFLNFKIFSFKKKVPSPTASLAIVMSMGVFVSDLFTELPYEKPPFSIVVKLAVLAILLLWVFMIASYTLGIYKREFYKRHMAHPVQSFGMGTWIAGTSVCSMGIILYLPEWKCVALFLIFVNSLFWVVYIGLCIRNFTRIGRDKETFCHGLLLLATVSTQSLAVDYSLIFTHEPPHTVFITLITVGVLFYLIGITFIIKSYLAKKGSLLENWTNTNCIIHGALSITGFAGIMTDVFSPITEWGLWFIIIVLFLVIEGLELVRAKVRIRQFGWKQAIGVYDVSQWARNFTFSMLLAFTLRLPKDALGPVAFLSISVFIKIVLVVLVVLFVYEGILFFKDRIAPMEGKR